MSREPSPSTSSVEGPEKRISSELHNSSSERARKRPIESVRKRESNANDREIIDILISLNRVPRVEENTGKDAIIDAKELRSPKRLRET